MKKLILILLLLTSLVTVKAEDTNIEEVLQEDFETCIEDRFCLTVKETTSIKPVFSFKIKNAEDIDAINGEVYLKSDSKSNYDSTLTKTVDHSLYERKLINALEFDTTYDDFYVKFNVKNSEGITSYRIDAKEFTTSTPNFEDAEYEIMNFESEIEIKIDKSAIDKLKDLIGTTNECTQSDFWWGCQDYSLHTVESAAKKTNLFSNYDEVQKQFEQQINKLQVKIKYEGIERIHTLTEDDFIRPKLDIYENLTLEEIDSFLDENRDGTYKEYKIYYSFNFEGENHSFEEEIKLTEYIYTKPEAISVGGLIAIFLKLLGQDFKALGPEAEIFMSTIYSFFTYIAFAIFTLFVSKSFYDKYKETNRLRSADVLKTIVTIAVAHFLIMNSLQIFIESWNYIGKIISLISDLNIEGIADMKLQLFPSENSDDVGEFINRGLALFFIEILNILLYIAGAILYIIFFGNVIKAIISRYANYIKQVVMIPLTLPTLAGKNSKKIAFKYIKMMMSTLLSGLVIAINIYIALIIGSGINNIINTVVLSGDINFGGFLGGLKTLLQGLVAVITPITMNAMFNSSKEYTDKILDI